MSNTIYLNPVIKSGLGEDTFWTWFEREFPNAQFGVPEKIDPSDVILHYSTKGPSAHPGQTICLMWELYPEMKQRLGTRRYDSYMQAIDQAARSSSALVLSTELMAPFYQHYEAKPDILPIAVNTDLFKPLLNKAGLREKYGIPHGKKIAFWGGNTHDFKGPHLLQPWADKHPDVHIIAAWTYKQFAGTLPGASNFIQVPQQQLVELMNCADFFLATSLLRPYYMVEWEAMACNLPFEFVAPIEKEFEPGRAPRDEVFARSWDRGSAKKLWSDYIEKFRNR